MFWMVCVEQPKRRMMRMELHVLHCRRSEACGWMGQSKQALSKNMSCVRVSLLFLSLSVRGGNAFLAATHRSRIATLSTDDLLPKNKTTRPHQFASSLHSFKDPNQWDREIDQKLAKRYQREGDIKSGGVGATAAGAVLGGLLAGPFGM